MDFLGGLISRTRAYTGKFLGAYSSVLYGDSENNISSYVARTISTRIAWLR